MNRRINRLYLAVDLGSFSVGKAIWEITAEVDTETRSDRSTPGRANVGCFSSYQERLLHEVDEVNYNLVTEVGAVRLYSVLELSVVTRQLFKK